MNQLKGKLVLKRDTVQVTPTFQKREFVIKTDENYPQEVLVELTQEKCPILDTIDPGTLLEVKINIRGRSWKSPQGEVKYFNSIQAWEVIVLETAEANVDSLDDIDDIPF